MLGAARHAYFINLELLPFVRRADDCRLAAC